MSSIYKYPILCHRTNSTILSSYIPSREVLTGMINPVTRLVISWRKLQSSDMDVCRRCRLTLVKIKSDFIYNEVFVYYESRIPLLRHLNNTSSRYDTYGRIALFIFHGLSLRVSLKLKIRTHRYLKIKKEPFVPHRLAQGGSLQCMESIRC